MNITFKELLTPGGSVGRMHATAVAYAPTTEHQVAEMRHNDRILLWEFGKRPISICQLTACDQPYVLPCWMAHIISNRLLLTIIQKVQRTTVALWAMRNGKSCGGFKLYNII